MKMRTFLVSLMAAALMLALANSCAEPTPADVVKDMLVQVNNGNFEKAVDYLSTGGEELNDEDRQKLEALYAQYKNEMDKKGGVENVEILKEEIAEDGQTATVVAQVTYGDESTEEIQQKLVNEDGKWRISMEK